MKNRIMLLLAVMFFTMAYATDSTFVQYKGTYIFPYGSMIESVEISVADTVLMIKSSIGTSRLDKIANDTFYLVAYNGIVVFRRDSLHHVNGIKIEAQSVLLEGDKQEEKSSGSKFYYIREDLSFINEQLFKKKN